MRRRLLLAPLITSLVAAGCGAAAEPGSRPTAEAGCAAGATAPGDGVYLGVYPDWAVEPLADLASSLGSRPAVVGTFMPFPLGPDDERNLDLAVEQVRAEGGMLLLTLQPDRGLDVVTDELARDLADRLAGYNESGVPVIVRFAHEMNGAWYPWGQQPEAYVAAFRRLADAVHAGAPGSAMMWAPHYGGGYPYAGQQYAAVAGGADAAVLDTDGDGAVTAADDPYAPYWPGASAVDWVGLSLYHWGHSYPWGENEVPEEGKFLAQMTGEYAGQGGDERAVPDFHAVYGEGHDKPVALAETAALWAPGRGGAGELAVKQAWWRQLLDPGVHDRLPRLAMVSWFEFDRAEPEIGGDPVDWRLAASPEVRDAFRADLPGSVRWADDVPGCTD
ncbi:Glycosyl hydrolase family 26 [Blastococcus aurantiacus]|uniref:Glycosyl hydrolase family 26 n=1 Tax=Blastococcus aurantiacus TaxID=1550231 RepID=A0A1G7I8T0_9ACTN|nr:glycosyl hydrolase [Blastococcus aurantiacus]SDF08874.1 Glycosyl hydrolase family 26 [Blastococcus aurantiacus]